MNRGTAYARLDDYSHAISDYNAALRLGGHAAELYADLGLAQLQMGNFGEAIVNFDSALAIAPGDAKTLYSRGIAKMKKGDERGADDVAAARRLDPGLPDVVN